MMTICNPFDIGDTRSSGIIETHIDRICAELQRMKQSSMNGDIIRATKIDTNNLEDMDSVAAFLKSFANVIDPLFRRVSCEIGLMDHVENTCPVHVAVNDSINPEIYGICDDLKQEIEDTEAFRNSLNRRMSEDVA